MFNLALRKYEPFIGVFGLQSVCETLGTRLFNWFTKMSRIFLSLQFNCKFRFYESRK